MFQSLRWRLTLLFVSLSAMVFITFALVGVGLFYVSLTAALDGELRELATELLPAIDMSGADPRVVELARMAPRGHEKLTATIQIYNEDEKLVQKFGPPGAAHLLHNAKEIRAGSYSLRIESIPLETGGKVIGYLQVELPTTQRDLAMFYYSFTVLLVTPLLLSALGLAGFLYSKQAVKPVEDALRVLRQFIADAGHELSTPVSIIQLNAEALEEELSEHALPTDRLAVIARSTERMTTLVGDLRDLSHAEAPQIQGRLSPVQLDEITLSCKQEFAELFHERKINLATGPLERSTVLANADSLKKVVSNLISNAMRYTDPGGTVTVSLTNDGRLARLSVEDTGIGIPAESIPHIFERFYRVDKSRSRAAGGSGLGLAIVKAIVETSHGRIEVESEVGKGSKFIVCLPVKTG